MKILLKTDLDLEATAASRVRELGLSCTIRPDNFRGLILVDGASAESITELEEIPELTTILPIDAECASDLQQIVEAATAAAKLKINRDESFAVRTIRRAQQTFSSVDANVAVGDAICRHVTSDVDLGFPDKSVYVEVIGKTTYIAIQPGHRENKKSRAGTSGRDVTGRTAIIQQVYLDQSDATMGVGRNIGRAAQAFGVQELLLAIREPADARDLGLFIEGVLKGREGRFKKLTKIDQERAERVPVSVADLYQTVRARQDEPLVVLTALGNTFSRERDALKKLYEQPRVNVLIGSQKDIPVGITRQADMALNVSPGLIFATEHGIPAAITGIVSCLQE